jgi:aryl sulfotransferase
MNTHNQAGIYWLASYPKSGNTWFRIVLGSLLSEKPIHINQFPSGKIASSRHWIEEALGFDSTYLTHDELDALRPRIYEYLGQRLEQPSYHKIHDAYTFVNGEPLLPRSGCLGALYFIRNPLDVAVSYAHHTSKTTDEVILEMSQPEASFCKGKYRYHQQLRQKLLSWSMHVKSWVENVSIPILTTRYEDMKTSPLETFMRAFQFLQITPSIEKLTIALENTRIDKLQEQENREGFRERPSDMARFFRKGIVGDWQNVLTETQISRIIDAHREVMETFGYLDSDGHPKL